MSVTRFYGFVVAPPSSSINNAEGLAASIRRSVDAFNGGSACWCKARNCVSSCSDCIFCCNYGDHDKKCNAFADWAIEQGYESKRIGYQRPPSRNMRSTIKRMKD